MASRKGAVAHGGQIVGHEIAAELVALVDGGPEHAGRRLEGKADRIAQAGCVDAMIAGCRIDLPDRSAAASAAIPRSATLLLDPTAT